LLVVGSPSRIDTLSAAEKILVIGGVMNVLYGVLTGFPMALLRSRGAGAVSKYLTFAHLGPLMQGPILLGMAVAVRMSTFDGLVETWGAWLLVAGSVLLALKDTLNWLFGVQDEFRERPATRPLGALSAVATTAGALIFAIGVLRAL
jgi:hypothetical protein